MSVSQKLDVKGMMCPMPLVKARKAMDGVEVGELLEVISTDRGSMKDFQGWAKSAKNVELIEQREEEEDGKAIYVHVVKRTK